jgi:AGZA family xanthine/uracil permease-like MFS transporter
VFSGFEFLGVILVTAIPFGIYDLVEAMDNVESAEAAGDAIRPRACSPPTASSA